MNPTQILGIILVALAGIVIGSSAWPMKLMRKFQVEHWLFTGMLVGLVILPWTITLLLCPRAMDGYASLPAGTLLKGNLWAAAWGVANVMCSLCYVRIGVGLTGAILTGMGVSLGVTLPMIVKGSGLFRDAPDLGSPAGITVLAGVAVMLVGVVLTALAGFGRDAVLRRERKTAGSFAAGLLMAIVAGVCSCGLGLAFVYSQGPIMAAMTSRGAGQIGATFAVWAAGLTGGALINIAWPLLLMRRNKSFAVLFSSAPELALAAIIGINMTVGILLMGTGMRWLGALGASVGFGIQQASQMLGAQGLGFVSGEWRGIAGRPRNRMYAAIVLLIAAGVVMACGNSMTKS